MSTVPNTKLESFLTKFKGHLTSKQKHAILNGLALTDSLENYAKQALGLMPNMADTKRNMMIWSPPGAGKTFTVQSVIDANNLDIVKYHGKATLNGFVLKMAKTLYMHQQDPVIPVWIDDCDSFFSDKTSLDFMKVVLDTETPLISWDVNIQTQIQRAVKMGDEVLAEALEHWSNGGVGIEIPLDQCRFIITTNKKLAAKKEIGKKKTAIDEHAIRDRVNFRAFDITDEEAWGWMSSVLLSSDVFKRDGFSLTQDQEMRLIETFHKHWDHLAANSMRTVKEAGALLFNNPSNFANEFVQHFVE